MVPLPPVAVTSMAPFEPPLQETWVRVLVSASELAGWVTVAEIVAVQLLASVTVTV